jgi:hypothetical protein
LHGLLHGHTRLVIRIHRLNWHGCLDEWRLLKSKIEVGGKLRWSGLWLDYAWSEEVGILDRTGPNTVAARSGDEGKDEENKDISEDQDACEV